MQPFTSRQSCSRLSAMRTTSTLYRLTVQKSWEIWYLVENMSALVLTAAVLLFISLGPQISLYFQSQKNSWWDTATTHWTNTLNQSSSCLCSEGMYRHYFGIKKLSAMEGITLFEGCWAISKKALRRHFLCLAITGQAHVPFDATVHRDPVLCFDW